MPSQFDKGDYVIVRQDIRLKLVRVKDDMATCEWAAGGSNARIKVPVAYLSPAPFKRSKDLAKLATIELDPIQDRVV